MQYLDIKYIMCFAYTSRHRLVWVTESRRASCCISLYRQKLLSDGNIC